MTRFFGAFLTCALATVPLTAHAQQPPDIVVSDGAFNTAVGGSVMPSINTGLRDGFFGAQRNTGVGYSALISDVTGNENSAVGTFALNFNNNGNVNSAVGYMALACNTSGNFNTAVGGFALSSLFTLDGIVSCTSGFGSGDGNTASGAFALAGNTSGSDNTANGYNVLSSNTTGSENTSVGSDSLENNTIGSHDTAAGVAALFFNTTGNNNTAVGQSALHFNTTGQNNAALGENALRLNTTGSSNIAVGYYAGLNVTTGSSNIDIGNQGAAGDSATIRIGTTGAQKATYIAGINGAHVTGSAVYISSTGQLGVMASSERYKTNIQTIGARSAGLSQLRPVTFHLKTEPKGPLQYGLVAEEVARVYPELVIRNSAGRIEGVHYEELAPMLLNEVQQQKRELGELRQQVAELKDLDRAMQAALQKIARKDGLLATR